jgi:hypothetical protein
MSSSSSSGGGRSRTRRNRNRRNRRSPSPVFIGFGDGPPQEVPLTPLMVYTLELDDPFAEDEEEDDDEDDAYDHGHDSEESDDEYNVMDPGEEINPGYAADLLESLVHRYPRYRLRDLRVNFSHPSPDADERSVVHYRNEFPIMLNQLVDGLEGYYRIKKLRLVHGNFWDASDDDDGEEEEDAQGDREVGAAAGAAGGDNDNDGTGGIDLLLQPDHDDLENLFGMVLCNHPSLDDITISKSRIQTQYWRLYTENFPPASEYSLCRLELEHVPLSAERCQLLCRMLHRRVALHALAIFECGLDENEWRVLCEAIADNAHVHNVMIGERSATVRRDTLVPLLRSPTSNVGHLVVTAGSWSDDDHAFMELIKELRTNTLLRDLVLYPLDSRPFPNLTLVEELVTTYNFELRTVTLMQPGALQFKLRIDPLLKRNRRVRALFRPPPSDGDNDNGGVDRSTTRTPNEDGCRRKPDDDPGRPYRLSRRSAWNLVLPEYSRFPTLLYRSLKSNAVDLFDQVQIQQQPQHHHPLPSLAPMEAAALAQGHAPDAHSDKKKSKNKKKGKKKQQAKRRR